MAEVKDALEKHQPKILSMWYMKKMEGDRIV